MTLPVEVNPLLMGGGGYRIAMSLRFRASASAYLSRTPGSAGSQTTWTWSGWVKRGSLGATQFLFSADRASATEGSGISFTSSDKIQIYAWNGSNFVYNYITTQVFRDPSSWYHISIVLDTSNGTSTDRVKLFVNGVRVTNFDTSSAPTSSAAGYVNTAQGHAIGRSNYNTTYYFDGYLAEVNFIDGQALDASSFGETDPVTGVWKPKKYTGTYGTNGFYLDFNDTSSTTALGYDAAGSNDWTVNNISLTSGSTYDSMIDTPTPYADGGNGRGNYCVLSPLKKDPAFTVSNGNLDYSCTVSGYGYCSGSIAVSSGKWYWEDVQTTAYTFSGTGVFDVAKALGTYTNSVIYVQSGQKFSGGSFTSYGSSWTVNDVIGVALDMDASPPTVTFYKNNVSQGAINLTSGVSYVYGAYDDSGSVALTGYVNFGQRAFAYTPPSGFKALNTQNLPEGTITTSGSFDGNGSTDGPFIYLNGVPTAMTINSNSVTFGTHADKLANGFKVRSSSSSYNVSGSNTYSITTTGAKFKYANAQGNP